MAAEWNHVDGRDIGKVTLYALSTCGWCKKTKRLLGEIGVAYDYLDVDSLGREDRDAIDVEVKKWNPRGSFPTIVLNSGESIVGFDEDKIREKLGA
jgi:glutaredoxin